MKSLKLPSRVEICRVLCESFKIFGSLLKVCRTLKLSDSVWWPFGVLRSLDNFWKVFKSVFKSLGDKAMSSRDVSVCFIDVLFSDAGLD